MLTFKTIYSDNGVKCVINLASIDLIVYRQDGAVTVHAAGKELTVSLKTAAQLEVWLGIA